MQERQCNVCGQISPLIPAVLGACATCIRSRPDEALPPILKAHGRIRDEFDLPPEAPRTPDGVECPLCVNACRLGEGELGLCGLRTVRQGRLVHLAGTPRGALVSWYDDPLPTNCVADWVCGAPGGRGRVNLAVFYQACTFDCVYCQNWHFRLERPPGHVSAEYLAAQAHDRTHCVCYFGGDPTPQLPHALATSYLLAGRGVTISLLGFHPHFFLPDLPRTSVCHADEAEAAARAAGLTRVRVGNRHLLSRDY